MPLSPTLPWSFHTLEKMRTILCMLFPPQWYNVQSHDVSWGMSDPMVRRVVPIMCCGVDG